MLTDWDIYRLAVKALLSGANPYLVGAGEMRFFNPPWTLIPLIPLGIAPWYVGYLANALMSFITLLLVTRRLRISAWGFFLIAISPMNLQSIIYGNIEWLPLLGLLAPSPLALLLFAIKPQATIGLILLTIWEEWKKEKYKGVLLAIAPTIILGVLSLVIWGLPPIPGPNNPGQHSLFPFSLLLGVPALYFSIVNQDRRIAALAGPFISPYVTFHGYLPALLPLKGKWLVTAVILAYLYIIVEYYFVGL